MVRTLPGTTITFINLRMCYVFQEDTMYSWWAGIYYRIEQNRIGRTDSFITRLWVIVLLCNSEIGVGVHRNGSGYNKHYVQVIFIMSSGVSWEFWFGVSLYPLIHNWASNMWQEGYRQSTMNNFGKSNITILWSANIKNNCKIVIPHYSVIVHYVMLTSHNYMNSYTIINCSDKIP